MGNKTRNDNNMSIKSMIYGQRVQLLSDIR